MGTCRLSRRGRYGNGGSLPADRDPDWVGLQPDGGVRRFQVLSVGLKSDHSLKHEVAGQTSSRQAVPIKHSEYVR
jgi:hypothetical protein